MSFEFQTKIKPSQVIAKESLRKSPFCRMFGCHEFEMAAQKIVEWLANNGNDWWITVPVGEICTEWELCHGHECDPNDHNFVRDYMRGSQVSELFVKRATRYSDYQEFKDSVIAKLIDWPA